MTIKIALVDDQQIVRTGLRLLLQAQPDMDVIGEASDTAEALALCRQARPDVVVVGLDLDDLQATQAIKRENACTLIVVLSIREDGQHFIEMVQAGASAYLPKRAAITQLVNAIHAVCAGQIVMHPAIASTLIENHRQPAAARRERSRSSDLTPQESRLLELFAEGEGNKNIAQRMGVSLRTVARYQATLLRKLGLHSRTELVRYAVSAKWNDPGRQSVE
jgi:DNA-binding NarL/FixJ family response regulator